MVQARVFTVGHSRPLAAVVTVQQRPLFALPPSRLHIGELTGDTVQLLFDGRDLSLHSGLIEFPDGVELPFDEVQVLGCDSHTYLPAIVC